jgi:hypothetical protein
MKKRFRMLMGVALLRLLSSAGAIIITPKSQFNVEDDIYKTNIMIEFSQNMISGIEQHFEVNYK